MVWATVLVMGIAVIFEPIRMGLAVLMLNRPRPMLQLLAFLCGGFAMGVCVGVVVLFILGSTPIASGRFTLPQVQITVGLLALLIAAALATNISAPMLVRRPMAGAGEVA
jgi:Sap, sulfolipid-1-addressing protein